MSVEDQGDESKSSVKDGDSAQPDTVTRILSAARILELQTQTETQTASVGQGVWAGVSQKKSERATCFVSK